MTRPVATDVGQRLCGPPHASPAAPCRAHQPRLDTPHPPGKKANNFRGSIYMIFDYMDHDMTGLLARAQREGPRFTVPQIKCYMQQLLMGLALLESNKVGCCAVAVCMGLKKRGQGGPGRGGCGAGYCPDCRTWGCVEGLDRVRCARGCGIRLPRLRQASIRQ